MMKKMLLAAVAAMTLLGSAQAATVTPFGGTTTLPGGELLRSETIAGAPPVYSGLQYTPDAPVTMSSVSTLFVNFLDIDGGAIWGSPRFSMHLTNGVQTGYMHVLLGTSPSFNDPNEALFTAAWSGQNVIGNNDPGRYDTSQFGGGSPFTTYAAAMALVGNFQLLDFLFVLDAGSGPNGRQELFVTGLNFAASPGPSEVPLPAAAWLFVGGLAGLGLLGRRKKQLDKKQQLAAA